MRVITSYNQDMVVDLQKQHSASFHRRKHRIAGALAAIPFAAHALLWLLGRSPAPSGPLASIGSVLLIVAIVDWMITVLRAAPSSQR